MTLVPEQGAFLLDVCQLIRFAVVQGFAVTAGELWRPPEMQKIYFETGRSEVLESWHGKRLAIDLNFFRNGATVTDLKELAVLGHFWESLHPYNRWGGNFDHDWSKADHFVDGPHFERRVPAA